MQGKFIVFEGPDGAGKTTVINHVGRALKCSGIPTVVTREPGGIEVAEKIRNIVKSYKLDNRQQTMLFMASMSINIQNVIKPLLNDGMLVLCDRYLRSTYVYQVYEDKSDIFNRLIDWACEGLLPDMEIVLDVDPDIALERNHKRDESPDAIESNGAEFLRMINNRYVDSFQNVPGWDYPQYKIITDNLDIADIVCYSIEYILSFLGYSMPRSVAYDTTKRYEDTINGKWYI